MIAKTTVDLVHGTTALHITLAPDFIARGQELADSMAIDHSNKQGDIELFACFLEHCGFNSTTKMTLAVRDAFDLSFGVGAKDIHAVVLDHGLDETCSRRVLKAYFSVWNAVSGVSSMQHNAAPSSAARSALFGKPGASLMGVFGGQLGSATYLDEARWLLEVYAPLVSDFVAQMTAFLCHEAQDSRMSSAYFKGINVLQWLTHAESTPNEQYLLSMPVCLPLLGLVQLMQVMILYKTLGVSPSELVARFKVVTGHSQGIAVATAFSMFTDEQSFYNIARKILGIQMLTGVLPQAEFPCFKLIQCANGSRPEPTSSEPRPMVAVQGVSRQILEAIICKFNSGQPSPKHHVHMAVINTADQFIVAGHIESATLFIQFVRARSVRSSDDQSRIPMSQRKPLITAHYLGITAPYHSPLLGDMAQEILEIVRKKQWVLEGSDLKIAVRATEDGHDIRSEHDLTKYLVESMCKLPVDWPRAVDHVGISHIVDFGAGGFGGFGKLAFKNLEGRGIPVVCAGALVPRRSQPQMGAKADLYRSKVSATAPNWLSEFGPRLVRTAYDGSLHIDTAMHRVLGLPPVMVAGMTPTTASEHFVAAVNNAGYHAELAGGSIYTNAHLGSKLRALASLIKPGHGITLNCIYVNQRQWSFQFPGILRLRAEGVPVTGLCIGGGVPSLEKATEIIDSLRSAGFHHMSFKPSNAGAIRHVVKIAKACADFPIVLQWTGGRAGGHHSLEDFHQPILETYAAVRSCGNIVLVAGSGFGDAEGSLPYITGNWSSAFGRSPMPFDGILVGSRVMASKEARTSPAAKQLIASCPGLGDANWQKSYGSTDGGITTITSEYGENNHVLVTRAALLIKDLQGSVLNQPRDKRLPLLLARKAEIIGRLNSDYARPWFGKKADGQTADLEEMTYAEVVARSVELMYVAHERRWISDSYRKFVFDIVSRTERRLADSSVALKHSLAIELSYTCPTLFAQSVVDAYPAAQMQLLASEDIQYFVSRCKQRGQKPVPFIPLFDNDFGTWLQKDLIWQSEDLGAVPDQDAQRVFIQHGVVAARYSTSANEPVKGILDGMYHGHIAALLERFYGGDASKVPAVESLSAAPAELTIPDGVRAHFKAGQRTYQLSVDPTQLPVADVWLRAIAGTRNCWLYALLTSPALVQGTSYIGNFVRRAMRPRPGQLLTIYMDGIDSTLPRSLEVSGNGTTELLVEYGSSSSSNRRIVLCIYSPTAEGRATLRLEFAYHPEQPLAPIHQDMASFGNNVRQLYAETWVSNSDKPVAFEGIERSDALVYHNGPAITKDRIHAFCRSVGNRSKNYTCEAAYGVNSAPMDFIILSALPSVLQVLSSLVFGDGQLSIVHLYNQLQLADGFSALAIGDSVRSVLEIEELINTPAGKQITLMSTSYVDDQAIATSKCAFLSRGYTADYALTFQRVRERYITIQMSSAKDIAVLEAKEWFVYCDDPASRPDPMSQLEFYIESLYRFQGTSVYSSIATTGRVLLKRPCGPSVHIANVDFEWKGATATADPVVGYLKRYETRSAAVLFDDGGYQIIPYNSGSSDDQMKATVPNSNEEYARLSWDSNPIHTNAYIADVAGLPGTITHGLWTSASTRAIIESCAADDQPERIRAYRTDFVGMVLPDDQLRTELRHTGMVGGRMLIKGQTFNATGNAILECTAEVAQPKTAYVFTGQGSQEVGMGMLLYEQSAAARGVWDRADAHMAATYGVSLLGIVRKNPKQITVHFGGKTGESIQRNYMLLERIDHSQLSEGVWVPVFPEITSDSTSYTFQMHTGLLNATQFTQVAIIVLGVAVIADIQSRGLMSHDSAFGGHSLGEYSALAAMCGMFTLEEIVDVVFYRGMMMQSAVERDEEGRSQYGMVAVNPSRVKKSFNEALLVHAVSVISVRGQGLLEVVNYNVDSHQYVVAGTLAQLAVLRLVLDSVAAQELSFDLNYSDGDAKSSINLIVSSVLAQAIDSKPRQGRASIPLAGIDVPFHSSLLLPGVPSFRALLTKIIHAGNVDYALLHKRYIPNLTAVPFEVSKQYFELVFKLTESPVVGSILDSWCDSSVLNNDDNEIRCLATKLVIELLAYQFASPVQWIKTQDQLFGSVGVRRLVEVGVSPILCGMSAKTLDNINASAGARAVQVALLHIERDRDSIYYLGREDAGDSNLDKIAKLPGALPVQPAVPAPVPVTAAKAQPASTEARTDNAAAVAEVPLNTLEVVHAIVAHKIKRKLGDVSVKRSIKELVGGKSTLQNEIIGDLHNDFNGKVPEKVEDIPLSDVAAAIGALSGAQLGPYSTSMVTRLFSSKMPGGFSLSAARAHLQTSYGLGPQRQNALLLTALTMEPSARLADEKGAVAWLGGVASAYAASAGISYAAATAASAGGSSKQLLGPAISSAAMESIQQKQRDHIVQQIEVLARYAGLDLCQDARLANNQLGQIVESQSKLAQIRSEFGDELVEGVQPCFDVRKARRFDSFWNWARQQAFEAIQRAIVAARVSVANGIAAADNVTAASNAENENAELAHRLRNCAHPELVQMLSGMAAILESSGDGALGPALKLARQLHALCAKALARPPVYVEMSQPMQPQTIVSPSGTVSYAEIPRANEPTFAEFVAHMRKQPLPVDEKLSADTVLPFIHIRQKSAGTSESSGNNEQWSYSDSLSETYFGSLSDMCSGGLSFAGKMALVTGCSNGSIGADIVRGLLSGGARVVATTSHFNRKSAQFFEDLYRTSGTRGSELILVPFNQGSINDIGQLVDYIYNDTAGSKSLGWDLDYVFPFAAVSDVGSFATNLGSHSEFAQRVMLTNVLRLMGGIKAAKEQRKYISRPSLVVLPLSPNQGIFGGDGLYGECKAGLEAAFNRWKSESWKGYLSIAGAVIGWTRGTGLMSANNLVAPEIEKHGVRTFSTREMAFSILGLLHPYICRAVHRSPIWADISGGINRLQDAAQLLASAQRDIDNRTRICRAVSLEAALDSAALGRRNSSAPANVADLSALADHKHQFPAPKSYNELHHLVALQGMVNLDKVVVITGYGEVGPYGNAETRWEMEAFGKFSVEGCIELAWIMGLIKHSNGVLPATDQIYVGWIDAKTSEPVRDIDIKPRYEEYILAHTGTRLIEPELCDGYDTSKKHVLREIQIDSDMAPFEASMEAAAAYKQSNGDSVDIWENPGGSGSWSVRFLKGALIRVPAAVRANRLVAGQLPTGWSAARYGIPEDIIKQVDTITLYTLVATVEALVRSGITDPYELYQHFHVSEVGSTTGSGIGGMKSVVDTFRNRYLDMELNNDAIQESFISTLQAWVNMLLISGSGPVKPVVGACATAVLSIDSAVETIQTGKARFMIAGGAEALSEVSSTEFANMGATGNSLEEIVSGREPAEMCRPCTSTRNGFMESQGAGIVTLMSASAAIEIGAPIYGIVAMSGTATDKQGRSVPAPGQGVLTSAREIKSNDIAPQRLSLDYRRRQIKRQIAALDAWKEEELAQIPEYTAKLHSGSEKLATQYMQQLEIDYARQVRGVQDVWGVDFWKQDIEISPLRGSLAVWGLTANDIGMASFHGTSTVANDKNESDVFNAKLQHIGRAPGHVVPIVCQKWLTGHPKGPAASFMLNGVIQSMRTGLVPGNRNADNIASELRAFDYALYLSKTVQTSGIKAALLTSFGFGQVGGELLIVHPDYLLATISREQLDEYNAKLKRREAKSYRYWQDMLVGRNSFVQVKGQPPYTAEQERRVYLDPLARAHYDALTGQFKF